jgi:hypothetical protein
VLTGSEITTVYNHENLICIFIMLVLFSRLIDKSFLSRIFALL